MFLDFNQRSLRSAEPDRQFSIRTTVLRIRTWEIGSSFSPQTSVASSLRHRERILPPAAWPSRKLTAASAPVSKDERQSPSRDECLKPPKCFMKIYLSHKGKQLQDKRGSNGVRQDRTDAGVKRTSAMDQSNDEMLDRS